MNAEATKVTSDPASLVAIAKAAHQTGDRELERAARRELEKSHGIVLRFKRDQREVAQA